MVVGKGVERGGFGEVKGGAAPMQLLHLPHTGQRLAPRLYPPWFYLGINRILSLFLLLTYYSIPSISLFYINCLPVLIPDQLNQSYVDARHHLAS